MDGLTFPAVYAPCSRVAAGGEAAFGVGFKPKRPKPRVKGRFSWSGVHFSAALAVQLKSRGSRNLGGDEELAQLFFSASFASSGVPVLESVFRENLWPDVTLGQS